MEASLDLVRVLLGLADASLRVAWARDALRRGETADLAARPEDLALRADRGESRARQGVLAILDHLAG